MAQTNCLLIVHLVGGFMQLERLWHSVGGGRPLGVQDEDLCLPCALCRLFSLGRFLQQSCTFDHINAILNRLLTILNRQPHKLS